MTRTKPPGVAGRILRQAGYDTRLTMANGEQVLLTLVIPVALLLGLVWVPAIDLSGGTAPADTSRVALALPGVLAVAVLSSAFASLAIATGFDRRSGALLLLATSPLSRAELVWARALSVLVIVCGQTLLLGALALGLGWRPEPGVAIALGFVIVGALALAACAVMVAGVLRAEATLALANGIFLLLLFAGGTALPLDTLPPAIGAIASILPSGALAEALRVSLLGVTSGQLAMGLGTLLAILAGWCILASVVARRTFRWD